MRSFDQLLGLLSNIPDPRRAEGKLYKLQHVLLFSILAVVTGGNSYRSIVTFIKVHRRRLNAAFGLHWRRAPAHTSIRYILQGLEPQAVEQIFPPTRRCSVRRHCRSGATCHRDRWQDTQTKLRQFHRPQGGPGAARLRRRSRSRPGARRYRGKVQRNPRCAAVARRTPCRAQHRHPRCHALPKKTFEAAARAQARLIVQLKDNQPSLLQKVETACASQRPVSSDTSVCTGRNRHETRSADVFSATRSVAGTEWKSLVKSIVRVTREVLHRDAKTGLWSSTSEVAYYVANSAVSACLAGTAIRHHWNVENTLHYTRDVTFQEDQSRIRRNPGVFARLRSFAYNVLCRNRTSTFSQDRYAAALAGFNALANWCFS